MAKIDEKFHNLLQHILNEGYRYEDPNRKGVYRRQISDYKIIYDFRDGFPALTTKKLAWKSVVSELLWILRGNTNIKYLVDNNINIWNKDAYNYYLKQCDKIPVPQENRFTYEDWLTHLKNKNLNRFGDIGRGYGAQLRNWTGLSSIEQDGFDEDGDEIYTVDNKGIDQFTELINTLKANPMATKKTVTFWNPAEKDQCALTPCHWSFEILVEPLKFWDRVNLMYKPNAISTSGDLTLVRESLEEANIPKYQFTLKWHQHSVDTFLGR